MKLPRIEQAVFTSAETDQDAGYQIVATSRNIMPADLDELTTWGPTHNTLLGVAPESVSLHFHPLPSGNCCIARTTPIAGHGSRSGIRLYTQNLIIAPEAFAAFGNHALRVFHTALAQGVFQWIDRYGEDLPAVELSPDGAIPEVVFLQRLRHVPGPAWMAVLLQTVLDHVTTAIVGGPPAVHVIAGLLSCLPMECRSDLSFSTGLKFSTRRPFRVIGISGSPEERDRVERLYNVTVADLTRPAPEVNDLFEAWPQLVYRVLRNGTLDFLSRRTSHPCPDLTWEDLPALGLEWLEEMDRTILIRGGATENVSFSMPGRSSPAWDEALRTPLEPGYPDTDLPYGALESEPWSDAFRREFLTEEPCGVGDEDTHEVDSRDWMDNAHAAHRGPWLGSLSYWNAGAELRELTPARRLRERHPALRPDLEMLDRLIHEVLAERPLSEQRLDEFWKAFVEETDDAIRWLVAEQYMRFTLELLDGLFDPTSPRQPEVAIRALDVFTLLSGD